MNSRDMRMIEHLPELLEAGVSSLKIEGRMKSAYYTAVVTNAYRHALDDALAGKPLDPLWIAETDKISHRPYTTGFYFGEPGESYDKVTYTSDASVAAVVEDCGEDGWASLTMRNKIAPGDALELLTPDGAPIPFTAGELFDEEGQSLSETKLVMMRYQMQLPVKAAPLSIVRKIENP